MRWRLRRFVIAFALVGLGVSLALSGLRFVVYYLGPGLDLKAEIYLDYFTLMVWPTSIMLMATHGDEFFSISYFLTLAMSILLNAMLYSIIGLLVGLLIKGVRAVRRKFPEQ